MFLCTDIAFSQLSNERSIRLLPSTSQQQLDSLSVMPGSFNVVWKDVILDPSSYMLDEMHSTILFTDSTLVDSVDCHFRVFPVYFGNEEKNKERSLIMKNDVGNFTPYVIGRNENTGGVFSDQGLQKSGSISRGILFGNNQNLSVNSTLNLQLSGKLSEQYSILASVTDDNIPIQPDGNTQQLQDFDQVFIQIYDEKTKLIAGDFQLRRPTGYFLNYFKRAQGAYFLTHPIFLQKERTQQN